MKKTVASLVAAFILVLSALPSQAMEAIPEEPSSTAIAFDLLFTRPLGLAATAVGAAIFVVGLPFTIPTGSLGVAADRLVGDPLRFTFRRPVGEIDSYDGYSRP